ncbi:MAG: hypothetical protein K2G30_08420, partial [Muribaculaceae bacterium]|nr:hypothetical protein [Muribaculaceae bacterium]
AILKQFVQRFDRINNRRPSRPYTDSRNIAALDTRKKITPGSDLFYPVRLVRPVRQIQKALCHL